MMPMPMEGRILVILSWVSASRCDNRDVLVDYKKLESRWTSASFAAPSPSQKLVNVPSEDVDTHGSRLLCTSFARIVSLRS
jgi:hypothetical protein